jgi:amino acid permease
MKAAAEPLLPTHRTSAAAGAGVVEATLTLVKTCVGTGVLALPYAMTSGGALALPLLLVLGIWNWTTCLLLLEARAAVPRNVGDTGGSSYSAVALAALGTPGVVVLEANLILTLVGVCTAMQVQASELLVACTSVPYALCVVASAVVLVPLVLQRTLRGIAWVSAAGLAVLIGGLLAVAAYGLSTYGADALSPVPDEFFAIPRDLRSVALCFGIICFSFGLQTTLLPVQEGLREPSRAAVAVHWSLAVIVLLYAGVGLGLGVLYGKAPPHGVQQLIFLNLPRGSPLALAVQCGSALVALLSYPLPLMPLVQLLPPRETACGRMCAALPLLGGLFAPVARLGARAAAVRVSYSRSSSKPDAAAAAAPPLATRSSSSSSSSAAPDPASAGGTVVRLLVLVITSLLAVALRPFGRAAGFVGSLSIVSSLVLPPLCHLRLVACPPSSPHASAPAVRRWCAAALDVALVIVGLGIFVVFTVKAALAAGDA